MRSATTIWIPFTCVPSSRAVRNLVFCCCVVGLMLFGFRQEQHLLGSLHFHHQRLVFSCCCQAAQQVLRQHSGQGQPGNRSGSHCHHLALHLCSVPGPSEPARGLVAKTSCFFWPVIVFESSGCQRRIHCWILDQRQVRDQHRRARMVRAKRKRKKDFFVWLKDCSQRMFPLGTSPVTVFSCGSDCNNPHGTIFSNAYSNFTITH
jgi:hypothetical protein